MYSLPSTARCDAQAREIQERVRAASVHERGDWERLKQDGVQHDELGGVNRFGRRVEIVVTWHGSEG
jgi:hypothetical protein